jgi:hypothetical protein
MIYCNLKGGLGNILFQIATGISFANDKKTTFSIPNYEWHLHYLNVEKERNPILNHANEYSFYFRNLKREKNPEHLKTLHYPFTFFEDSELTDNCIIDGYFQSEKYFKHHRKEILKQFGLPFKLKVKTLFKYPFFTKSRLTSIHVRRGEYLMSPIHYNQNMKYYDDSIHQLDSITDKFVVFSDDIVWCKENFIGEKFIFIENEKDYIEIYLMSICTNNIICNSSFSWWGAWLNDHANKKVIAPENWFKTDELSAVDLIPESWNIL